MQDAVYKGFEGPTNCQNSMNTRQKPIFASKKKKTRKHRFQTWKNIFFQNLPWWIFIRHTISIRLQWEKNGFEKNFLLEISPVQPLSMMVLPEHTHLTNSWMRVAILLVVMYTNGVSWYGSILKTCYWDDSAILLWGPFSVRIWLNIAWGRRCPTPAWESGHSVGSFGCTKWFV